jgi:hypothetical protein
VDIIKSKDEQYRERARTIKDAVMSELPWIVQCHKQKSLRVDAWLKAVEDKPDEFWHKIDAMTLNMILLLAMKNRTTLSME